MDVLSQLARHIQAPAAGANASLPTGSIIKGSVTAVDLLAATISCTLMGDTTTVVNNIAFADFYTPVVGDNCLMVKQGTDLFALGTVAGTAGSGSWSTPTLTVKYTSPITAAAPVKYRPVFDNGDIKVQLKGTFSSTGGGTGIVWTYPAGSPCIPATEIDLNVVTDLGSLVQLQFQHSGEVLTTDTTAGAYMLDGLEYFVA